MVKIERFTANPIISPEDVKPINDGFEVIGAFNAAVAQYNDETILVLRVAERPVNKDENKILIPVYNCQTKTTQVITESNRDGRFDTSDSRVVKEANVNHDFKYLTSLSYLRLARSTDGVNFSIEDHAFVYPHNEYETYGIEDARCTKIGDKYYLNFSSVSPRGICVELISTSNFESYQHEAIIFNPDNKDVVLFPEKIKQRYYALNRPTVKSTGHNDVWISSSPELHSFGDHHWLFAGSEKGWDNGRVGAGLPPIKTKYGWLEIYHAADKSSRYCMGAMLLDLDDPTKIIARLQNPILEPEAIYEKEGFFGEVVFGCGYVQRGDEITMYYGVADTSVAGCRFSLKEVLKELLGDQIG
ncbi:glycoside hydrolase family 130 protein [Lapidilactobacillus achengensis]|uniref:Glycoside hydrolase family 130 protein n=1 Tax=Lapidilactobacillus achengensis TaxID=2486000 RepID=A0ABW1UNU7_9LACO|nr:glycoside hydrolase family 130 protein [Lapidilactobacillus achengensis]